VDESGSRTDHHRRLSTRAQSKKKPGIQLRLNVKCGWGDGDQGLYKFVDNEAGGQFTQPGAQGQLRCLG
jgi:hypothetical protein